jgi:acyl-coenzyme A thioesterase PaaI-like protein
MDYEAIKGGLTAAIPYNAHLGLEVVDVGPGRGVVRLPDDERLRNHVGTQHAGGLFSAAEAASGAAFVGAFAEKLGEITPLARSASIQYVALARGPITATATLEGDAAALLERLDAEGKVSFPVEVTLTDGEGVTVATATVQWHVRKNA